jgi:ABC-2 type transport system ATP-binding protein
VESVIAVKQLTKTYESGFKALNGVDLEIRRGEILRCSVRTARVRRR